MKKTDKFLSEEQFERDMEEVDANVLRCLDVIPEETHPGIVAFVGAQLLSAGIVAAAADPLHLNRIRRRAIRVVNDYVNEMYDAQEALRK